MSPQVASQEQGRSEFSDELAATLLAARTVLVFGEVTTALARRTTAQLLALAERGDEPIRMVVHSPGGHVEAGDTIFDVVRFIRPRVLMIGSGWVSSAGALIYVAAPSADRFALPNTRFLLHEPSGGAGGPVSDIEIEVVQILAMRERLSRIFAEATGQSIERLRHDTDRNHWLNAEEAVRYGLVSRVITSSDQLP